MSPERDGNERIDGHMVRYVIRYYAHLMTPQERKAQSHLYATMKTTQGRSDVAAQAEAQTMRDSPWQSSDEDVLRLASEGYEAFAERTAKRILAEHRPEMFLNNCPHCGRLAKTPKARQCRFCYHDWHET
jgi:hypothetical protein